ncbi:MULTISPECIES: cysteine peptidase family C39 domain-containing protein [Thioalkalivibrio]|uniref:cysteine peptidase family C39 domain-containing protein n=1 Tax=Thioalkalivibrio TaxID=106633 RepID=UPI0003650827|nr:MULTISPECIES: cysteine peptidase family C39 domain-containing protein [Thioalkalivibrio]
MERYALQVEEGVALEVPYVRQTSRTDCGSAALASVMEYYRGSAYSPHALSDQYPHASPRGYSLGELREIAREHGFAAFVVPGDESFLRSHLERGRPLIVPLQVRQGDADLRGTPGVFARLIERRGDQEQDSGYDHYVVVVGMDDSRGKVLAMDPARGPVEIDFGDFATAWERMHHAVLLLGLDDQGRRAAPH